MIAFAVGGLGYKFYCSSLEACFLLFLSELPCRVIIVAALIEPGCFKGEPHAHGRV